MYKKIIVIIAYFLSLVSAFSQFETQNNDKLEVFTVKVQVLNDKDNMPIKDAEVTVNGIPFSFSEINETYTIKSRRGDQLMIQHPNFETVTYTIQTNEDIKILVKDIEQRISSYQINFRLLKSKRFDYYPQLIDSAKAYMKKDIDKSLSYIAEVLKENQSQKRNANTYKTLADIYFHWQQYDIAINNYKISLQIIDNTATELQLAKAQFLAKKYKDSRITYDLLNDKKLKAYDRVLVLEGIGDVLLEQKAFKNAIKHYKDALGKAMKKNYKDKITDINAKIADTYSRQGKVRQASIAYSNTLKLLSGYGEAEMKSLKVEEDVADFYNDNRRYDEEIALRKKTLKNVGDKKNKKLTKSNDNSEALKDSITPQKINYKIGNAYILKEDYPKAIEYLERSVGQANKRNDLEVKKHATRRLSEVYSALGNSTKALSSYRTFVTIVDSLYIKKEQEIYQVKRLTQKIAKNQSRIAILEKDKELSESKLSLAYKDQQLTRKNNKLQRIVIYSLIGGLLLMGLVLYFMYRSNKEHKFANNLLALKSMRSQMNPHFIFNALNSVNSFIAVNDERNANRYLSEFSVLMRSVLENSDEDFIPLSKEIELLELYVKLEHNRFKDKFDYNITIDKTIDIEAYKIPPMLLQPYIENAIWHGLRYKKDKGILNITINSKGDDSLEIIILDNGVGRKKSIEMKTKNQLKQKSKGMSTIKNRIEILNDMYQDKIVATISDAYPDGSGTKVEVTLKK